MFAHGLPGDAELATQLVHGLTSQVAFDQGLVVLADLVDTIRGDYDYSNRLWGHVDTKPQYISGLTG